MNQRGIDPVLKTTEIHGIGKRMKSSPKLSGGAPFLTCACVYKQEKDVPGSFILPS